MQQNKREHIDNCNFKDVEPIMVALPYPAVLVREKNLDYANLLSFDYCGSVSELSAITQYINNENRLSCDSCAIAKTVLGIAMAEMIHMQKLGQLIALLGGNIDFYAKQRGKKPQLWTPQYVDITNHVKDMLLSDIEAEKAAINQYRMHMRFIKDDCVLSMLERIIKDEEYHIMILQALLKDMS